MVSAGLSCLMQEGMLVVTDLSDPLLSPEDTNGIFDLWEGNRLVGEATTGGDSDGLILNIVDVVLLMRHEDLRVAISTQSPKVLSPEFLELVSLTKPLLLTKPLSC